MSTTVVSLDSVPHLAHQQPKPADEQLEFDDVVPAPEDGQARASTTRLYLMVCSDFGLAFCWVVKYVVTTPYLAHTLRAGPIAAHATWILGPLSGLVTAPIVGVLSDRCKSRFGRRRPFMAGGALACVLGMALFAGAVALPKNARLPVAIFGFGVLDFAANVIMFPSRALLGDLLPAAQQHDAQGAAAVLASAAEIAAGAFLFALKEPLTHVQLAFGVASLVLIITTYVSLRVCSETPLDSFSPSIIDDEVCCETSENSGPPNAKPTFSNDPELKQSFPPPLPSSGRSLPVWREIWWLIVDSLTNFPRALVPIGLVYGLSWLGWYATLPWYSAWLGTSVMGGSSSAAAGSIAARQYQKGVNYMAGASVVKAVVSLTFSAIYPRLLRLGGRRGEAIMFSVPFVLFAGGLAIVSSTRNALLAASVVVAGGIPFVATQTIPIAILVQKSPHQRLASNLGVLNLFVVIPQMIDTSFTGFIAEKLGYHVLMRIGAMFALTAGLVGLAVL